MKNVLILKLNDYNISQFKNTIKDMWDYARFIMNTVRFFHLNFVTCISFFKKDCERYVKIDIKYNYRLYVYISKDKYFSMVFPFGFKKKKDGSMCFTYKDIDLDEKLISEIISIFNQRKDDNSIIDIYADNNYSDHDVISDKAFLVTSFLLSIEPGYVRHDHDVVKANGLTHPEYHFDINFSKKATWKFGLDNMLAQEEFEKLFDKSKERLFCR